MSENETFNWELWLNDGEPLPPPCSISQNYKYADLIKELAFHEASHLVFDIISEKLDLGFSPIEAIKITPNDPKGNYVRGFHSPYPNGDSLSALKKRKWYFEKENENHNRLFVKVLGALAGYTSYQVFMEDSLYFINPVIEETESVTLNYYRIDCLPDHRPSDFQIVYEMLGWINQDTIKRIKEIQEVVKIIARHPSVSNAIGFVKNYLLKNVGSEISGTEMDNLKRVVHMQTTKISMEKYLNQI